MDEIEKVKKVVQVLRKDCEFSSNILRHKVVVGCIDTDCFSECIENTFVLKVNGQTFDDLVYSYFSVAEKLEIVLSPLETVKLSDDTYKQIFINKIHAKLSEKYLFVVLKICNANLFEQLKIFVKFLPYNFKLVLNKNVLHGLDFFIKQLCLDEQQPPQELEPFSIHAVSSYFLFLAERYRQFFGKDSLEEAMVFNKLGALYEKHENYRGARISQKNLENLRNSL